MRLTISTKLYSKFMINLAKKLFPINRSLTGNGVRETLSIIKSKVPLEKKSFSSGKKVFDWVVPQEWEIKDGYILDLKTKKKFADFKKNNLHIVGYSEPKNEIISFNKLKKHIFFEKKNKKAIPYVTSYYKKNWGFCLSKIDFNKMKKNKYKILIDSKFFKGKMDYGEILLKGKSKKEILFTTYICHPSMANNEISGPVVNTALIDYVRKIKNKKYSYRFIFVPETIGTIAYIQKNLTKLKKDLLAGFVINCAGDERDFSFVHTPSKNTFADEIMKSSFIGIKKKTIYDFKDRSSDERQYCSPGIELPVCSFSRSKAGSKTFPEYHTSLDDFKVVTEKGLYGSFNLLRNIIDSFELILFPKSINKCEPFLTKKKLYPTLSNKNHINRELKNLLNVLAYSNGKRSIFEISNTLGLDLNTSLNILRYLKNTKLIS